MSLQAFFLWLIEFLVFNKIDPVSAQLRTDVVIKTVVSLTKLFKHFLTDSLYLLLGSKAVDRAILYSGLELVLESCDPDHEKFIQV